MNKFYKNLIEIQGELYVTKLSNNKIYKVDTLLSKLKFIINNWDANVNDYNVFLIEYQNLLNILKKSGKKR